MNTSKNLSIYVVDDDRVFSAAVTDQLSKVPGTVVQSFETGEQCLQNPNGRPDVVLLDYYLNSTRKEAMNGLQVLKKIVKKNPEAKIIMLSVQDNMEVAVDTMKHGAYDYVVKNDKVFLRARQVVANAVKDITHLRNMKNYRFWTHLLVGILLTLVLAGVAFELKYPPAGY